MANWCPRGSVPRSREGAPREPVSNWDARYGAGPLDGGDAHAALLEGGQVVRIGLVIGDELVHLCQQADPRECNLSDLRAVGDDDHLAGALKQRVVGPRPYSV